MTNLIDMSRLQVATEHVRAFVANIEQIVYITQSRLLIFP